MDGMDQPVSGSAVLLDLPLAAAAGSRQPARVRSVLTQVSLVGVLAIGASTGSSCTSDDESTTATAGATTGPVADLSADDIRDVLISVFCGADYLPVAVNDMTWRAEEVTTDEQYWVPPEWAAVAEPIDDISDSLVVQLRMEPGERRLVATANGRAVKYRPMEPGDPDNVCA